MKCPVCKEERLVFFCLVEGIVHIVCCIQCAVRFGYRIIEEVKEARDDATGMEVRGTREGL